MTSLSGMSYSVGSPSRVCSATGAALVTGEPYMAALYQEVETGAFVRLDFAASAWEAGTRAARSGTGGRVLLGSWTGRMPEPGAKPRMLIDDASLLELFEQTGEEGGGEPEGGVGGTGWSKMRAAFRYVLALLLIRKRLLVLERSVGVGGSGGEQGMLVRVRGEPVDAADAAASLIHVEAPGLDEAAIAGVAEQLQSVLASESGTGAVEVKPNGAGGQG